MTSKKPSKPMSTSKRVLLFFEENLGEWTPKVIASRIGANYNTVRGICHELHKKKALLRTKVGLCAFYRSTRPYENDFFRMSRVSTTLLPEIHNLHLYNDGISHQGRGYRLDTKFNFDFKFDFGFKRQVTVRYGEQKDSVNVWVSCSENPLAFEDFKHLLTFIQGLTLVKTWGNLERWVIKRYGINADNIKFEETPEPTLLLSGFAGWFAQQYDKEIDGVMKRRTELESRNAITADKFIQLVSGGLTNNQIMNIAHAQNKESQSIRRELRSMAKYFSDVFAELTRTIRDLKEDKKK